tara:strand:- start:1073 stop:1312 length:240 start_codon:yes stop_codon:yes gene_type:complete
MALEDMKSRYSPQPIITFKRDKTVQTSPIEPNQSIIGQNNLVSSTITRPSILGQNNLLSPTQTIFFGSGLANTGLFTKK